MTSQPIRRLALQFFSLMAMPGAWPSMSFAQDTAYPAKPIKLIVPNAAGSSVDTIGRRFANSLASAIGQSIFIDNKAGAAGALGIEAGKLSAPDGYTLMVVSSSSITVAPLLQKAVTYDPLKDFDFVSLLAVLANALVCNTALKVSSVADLIGHAKANPGKVNMASAGPGSVSHLAGVALATAAGFESLHVPYKGGSQSVASVVSGETHWTLTPAPAAMALVKAGRLRALGHSLAKASHPLGSVPAIGDTVAGFEYGSWIGLMAPKGLAPQVADKLHKAVVASLQNAALREAFEANGAVPMTSMPEEFRIYLAKNIEQNRKAIRAADIKAE